MDMPVLAQINKSFRHLLCM